MTTQEENLDIVAIVADLRREANELLGIINDEPPTTVDKIEARTLRRVADRIESGEYKRDE